MKIMLVKTNSVKDKALEAIKALMKITALQNFISPYKAI